MEYKNITFSVVITQTGLAVRAVGALPETPLTQSEIYEIVNQLNTGETVTVETGVVTGSDFLRTNRTMVEAALREITAPPPPEEPEGGGQ